MPPPHQTCYFHKNHKLTKFCTSKQCTLPLCQKCEPVHVNEHHKTQTQPQIMFIQTAHDEAVRQLQQQLMFSRNSKSDIEKKLKLQRQQMISNINQYFLQKEQNLNDFFSNRSAQYQKIQEKLKKIKRGSLKTMIFFFSENNQLKETLRKINKDSQIYDQKVLKQLQYILKSKSGAKPNLHNQKSRESQAYEHNFRRSDQILDKQKEVDKQDALQIKVFQRRGNYSLSKKVPQFIKNMNGQQGKSSMQLLKIPIAQPLKPIKNMNAQSQRISYIKSQQLVKSNPIQIKQKKYYNELKRAIQARNQPQNAQLLNPKRNVFEEDKVIRSISYHDKQNVQQTHVSNNLELQPKKYPSFLKKQQQNYRTAEICKMPQRQRFSTQYSHNDMDHRLKQIRNKHKSTAKIIDRSLNIKNSSPNFNDIQTKYSKNYNVQSQNQLRQQDYSTTPTVPKNKQYGKQASSKVLIKQVNQANKQKLNLLPLSQDLKQRKKQHLQTLSKQKFASGKKFSYNITNQNSEQNRHCSPFNETHYQVKHSHEYQIQNNSIKADQIQRNIGQKPVKKRYQSYKKEEKIQPLLQKSKNYVPHYQERKIKEFKTPQNRYYNWSNNQQGFSGQQSKCSSQWQYSKHSIVDQLYSPNKKSVLENNRFG